MSAQPKVRITISPQIYEILDATAGFRGHGRYIEQLIMRAHDANNALSACKQD